MNLFFKKRILVSRFWTWFIPIFVISFFFLFSSPLLNRVLASDKFDTRYKIFYKAREDGVVLVEREITFVNKMAETYVSSYGFILEGIEITNVRASDKAGEIIPQVEKNEGKTKINVVFNEIAVGLGKELTFKIEYEALNLAIKKGQIWELNLPGIGKNEDPSSYHLEIAVPKKWGRLAYISPMPGIQSNLEGFYIFDFEKENLGKSDISAAFGQFQVFNFNLKYHLYNPGNTAGMMEIALIPDTDYQKIYLEKIFPQPEDVRVDTDGNWMASYLIESGQKIEVSALGKTKVFNSSWKENKFEGSMKSYLSPGPFWESDKEEVVSLAKKLKTAKKIYDYVVANLNYDSRKINQEPKRLGALEALKKPNEAICTEFTDLFIALCRSAGIPARELNGFAYTTNKRVKPLDPLSDILHSWPEYWNEEKKSWIPVDPTWEKTTEGVDFFNKLDFNHLVFVIHGQESDWPLPAGSYKLPGLREKDVSIDFGSLPEEEMANLRLSFSKNKDQRIGGLNYPILLIENLGPTAVYDLKLNFLTEGVVLDPDFVKNSVIKVLPPYGKKELLVKFKPIRVINFRKAKILVNIFDQQAVFELSVSTLFWSQIGIFLWLLFLGILASFLLVFLFKGIKRKKGA